MAFFRRNKKASFDILSNYSWFVPGWKGLGTVVLLCLAGLAFSLAVQMILITTLGRELTVTYGTLICYPLMFIPVMVYASVKSSSNSVFGTGVAMDSNSFRPVGGVAAAIFSAFAVLSAAIVLDPVNAVLPEMKPALKEALKAITEGPLWVALLSTAVFAPFFEEWLCRGIILRGLLTKVKPIWAILLSALFFALMHGNIWQGITAFIIGGLFGWVYYRTGSLKLTMMMHCINNTFAVLLARVPALKDTDSLLEVLPGPQYWTLFAAGILVLACSIVFLNRIKPAGKFGGCMEIKPDELS